MTMAERIAQLFKEWQETHPDDANDPEKAFEAGFWISLAWVQEGNDQ